MIQTDNFLSHYGIKRKSGRYPFGSGSRPYQGLKTIAKKGSSEKTISKSETKSNDKKEITNEEIRARNDRQRLINESLRLQREFNQLTAKEKSAGRKFVEDVLKDSGKKIAVGYIVGKTNQALNKKKKDKDKE